MIKYFYNSVQIFLNTVFTAVGADEHGGADWAAGVPAHEGVDGEPGRRRGGHHPPHLLLHPRHGRPQGKQYMTEINSDDCIFHLPDLCQCVIEQCSKSSAI